MSSPIKMPRLSGWIIAAITLQCIVAFAVPANAPVVLYKLSLVTVAAVLGYWLDRSLFYFAKPDDLLEFEQPQLAGVAMLRRAIIVAATILGVTMGL